MAKYKIDKNDRDFMRYAAPELRCFSDGNIIDEDEADFLHRIGDLLTKILEESVSK